MITGLPIPSVRVKLESTNWRHAILFLCVTIMEALWVGPMLHRVLSSIIFSNPIPMPLLAMVGIVLANMLVGLSVRRGLVYMRRSFKQQRLPILLVMFVCVYTTLAVMPALLDEGTGEVDFTLGTAFNADNLSPDAVLPFGFIITPILFVVYSRGTMIGRYPQKPVAVGILSRLAILMFFLTAAFTDPDMQADMAILLPFMFIALLLANALARSTSLRVTDSVLQNRFGRRWFTALVGITTGTVGSGMLLAIFFGTLNEEQLRQIFAIPLYILGAVGLVVSTPFLIVIGAIVGIINIEEIQPEQEIELTGERESVASADNPQIDIGDELRTFFELLQGGVFIIAAVFIVGLVVYFWIRYFLSDELELLVQDTESVSERERIAANLFGNPFKKLLEALGNLQQSTFGGNFFGELTIRWAYARMERMGRRRGFPREQAQTPNEYRTQLGEAFPGGDDYIRTITAAYVAIRYGEVPESSAELEEVRHALDSLKNISAPQAP